MKERNLVAEEQMDILDIQPSVRLLDGDLLVGRLRNLWHDNFEDAILQTSLNAVLINTRREREAAMEFADGAFTDPDFRLFGRSLFHFLIVAGGGDFSGSSVFSFDRRLSRFVFVILLGLGYPALLFGWTGLVAGFGATRDREGVAIGPFDIDVLLLNTRELAVKCVSFLRLADIELRLECAQRLHLAGEATAGEVGIVIHQTENRRELAVEATWE